MRESSRDTGAGKSVVFATSNEGKVVEARIIFEPFGLRVKPLAGKGVEIQAEITEVAAYAAVQAAKKYGRALIVEDAGLYVESLGGFPGPFSSFAFRSIGIPGLLRLLRDESQRGATFRSAVAYGEPGGTRTKVFEGSVRGTISRAPSGSNGFGFDPVFVPERTQRSIGEMTLEEKCSISHRGMAMRKFATWYLRR
jgi:XTP/dITP diphosphohydrolase